MKTALLTWTILSTYKQAPDGTTAFSHENNSIYVKTVIKWRHLDIKSFHLQEDNFTDVKTVFSNENSCNLKSFCLGEENSADKKITYSPIDIPLEKSTDKGLKLMLECEWLSPVNCISWCQFLFPLKILKRQTIVHIEQSLVLLIKEKLNFIKDCPWKKTKFQYD